MPLNTTTAHSFRIRLLCLMLTCVLLFGILCTSISAAADNLDEPAESTGENTPETTPENSPETDLPEVKETSLTESNIEKLAEWISAAKADDKSDTRTPRDKFTAAYLAGNLAEAKSIIKEINEAQKDTLRLSIDYDAINNADLAALIKEMKTKVDTEKGNGILDTIMQAVGSILSWMTVIGGGNYIVALVIFSLIVEIAMLPISIKQQKNSIRQAELRPKEIAIRRKYAGREDQATKQKIATEINEMYQKEGFNPASGCLPLLVQFPIIIILYNVVVNPLVYVMGFTKGVSEALVTFVNTSEAAGGFGRTINSGRGTIEIASLIGENGFIEKLSKFQYFTNSAEIADAISGSTAPNFNLFGLNLAKVPSLTEMSWLLIFPVLTFIVYFGSMKITRKMTYQPTTATDQATGCSNSIMDIVMPLFSVFISFSVPAALGLYWIVKSILGTISRISLTKLMPVPQFTEEDYKAAFQELKRGTKETRPSSGNRPGPSGKPVRSLHRIDDEDFEDTRERALAQKAKLEALEAEENASKAEKEAAAGVKNEDDRPMMTMRDIIKNLKAEKKDDKNQEAADKNDSETGNSENAGNAAGESDPQNTESAENGASDKAATDDRTAGTKGKTDKRGKKK